jgi:DNA-binding MarR family transcriptional regulator
MKQSLIGAAPVRGDLSLADYQALAAFRYQIRQFLHFSETAAKAEGLEPQQHQMLLAIRAWDEAEGPDVGKLASHLLIRHHSAVGLVDRLAAHGLVERTRGSEDRRHVRVRLTTVGEEKLARLASEHRAELRNSGPVLVAALAALLKDLKTPVGQGSQIVSEEKDVSGTQNCH